MKLSTKARNKLPNSAFAGPGRSYPVEDPSHARDAKARASEMYNKGKLSSSTKATIDARANRVLHQHSYGESQARSMNAKLHK